MKSDKNDVIALFLPLFCYVKTDFLKLILKFG